jgi:hypothetical protein
MEILVKKKIKTGVLDLRVIENKSGMREEEIYDIAARANPKRGFLIVSKLIGRHIPVRPKLMRQVVKNLADQIPRNIPGPVVFIGMAETAVGIGQGIHKAWSDITDRQDVYFIQSTRQTHPDMEVWTTFEEGHSHATNHLLHKPEHEKAFSNAKSVVIVDDECSTGKTFLEVKKAIKGKMPKVERVIEAVITDWCPDKERDRISLVLGTLGWEPNGTEEAIPGKNADNHGETRPGAAPGRTGYKGNISIETDHLPVLPKGRRVCVLADGENSYDALLVAEWYESQGLEAAIQSITRSPAHVGEAMRSRAIFSDSYGSGATCYSYNLESFSPDYFVVVTENIKDQGRELEKTGFSSENIFVVKARR